MALSKNCLIVCASLVVSMVTTIPSARAEGGVPGDLTMWPPVDMTMPDLATDMGPDLARPDDLTQPVDLTKATDLAKAADLAKAVDLQSPADLALDRRDLVTPQPPIMEPSGCSITRAAGRDSDAGTGAALLVILAALGFARSRRGAEAPRPLNPPSGAAPAEPTGGH